MWVRVALSFPQTISKTLAYAKQTSPNLLQGSSTDHPGKKERVGLLVPANTARHGVVRSETGHPQCLNIGIGPFYTCFVFDSSPNTPNTPTLLRPWEVLSLATQDGQSWSVAAGKLVWGNHKLDQSGYMTSRSLNSFAKIGCFSLGGLPPRTSWETEAVES